MVTVTGRLFILREDNTLERITDDSQVPEGYIATYDADVLVKGLPYIMTKNGKVFHPPLDYLLEVGHEKFVKRFSVRIYIKIKQQPF